MVVIVQQMHTSRVVASRQQDTTCCFSNADDVTRSGGTENAILADDELLDAVRRTNLGNQLDNFRVPVSAITTDDETGTLCTFGNRQEDRGDKGLAVVGLLKDGDLFAKTRGTGLLVSKGLELHFLNHFVSVVA